MLLNIEVGTAANESRKSYPDSYRGMIRELAIQYVLEFVFYSGKIFRNIFFCATNPVASSPFLSFINTATLPAALSMDL